MGFETKNKHATGQSSHIKSEERNRGSGAAAGHWSDFFLETSARHLPRASMTLKKWVHEPLILGNDPIC